MAYDFRSDTLLINTPSLDIHRQPYMLSSFRIHTEDTLAKRADLLGMDANLTMSAVAGSVQLAGSAHLLNYRKITERTRLFLVKLLGKLATLRVSAHGQLDWEENDHSIG